MRTISRRKRATILLAHFVLLSLFVSFGASAAMAQNWRTSVVETRFVSDVAVSSSSTSSSATDEVRLSGTMAALVQIQHPTDPCTPVDPCRSVPVRIIYVAEATGVGQSTGTTYRAIGASTVNGTLSMPGTFAWQLGLRFVPPSPIVPPDPIVPPNPIALMATTNVSSAGTATAASLPPSGLVSWWQAEGNGLDALAQNNGTLGEVLDFVPGRVGQAFSFAEHGYVQAGPSSSLQPANVTAMAWVRHLGFPGQNNYVLSQGGEACVAASYALYTGTQNLTFYVFDGGTFWSSPDAGPGVWDGNWHLVAGTYDGQAVRLFVDGVEVGNGTPVTAPIAYALPYQQFNIGAYRGSCDLRFDGDIDEVKIFNRALSAAEVQSIFSATP